MNKLVTIKWSLNHYNYSPSDNGLACGFEKYHPPMGMDYTLPSQSTEHQHVRVYIPDIFVFSSMR